MINVLPAKKAQCAIALQAQEFGTSQNLDKLVRSNIYFVSPPPNMKQMFKREYDAQFKTEKAATFLKVRMTREKKEQGETR